MNAREELLEHIKNRHVIYVQVEFNRGPEEVIVKGCLGRVLPALDFNYDSGFGCQELSGTIWYADGTWSDRREYDGSEWWEHQVCPEFPDDETK